MKLQKDMAMLINLNDTELFRMLANRAIESGFELDFRDLITEVKLKLDKYLLIVSV